MASVVISQATYGKVTGLYRQGKPILRFHFRMTWHGCTIHTSLLLTCEQEIQRPIHNTKLQYKLVFFLISTVSMILITCKELCSM